ncbi:VanW family protein, partial [Clostridium neonatale]
MGRNRSKKKRSNNNANDVKRKVITVMLAIVIVGAVCLSAYTLATKKVVGKWEDKVYPGITIDNIDIGGMSKEEAKAKLEEHLKSEIANKSLHIKVKDQDFELIYSDINPQYDINDAVEQAFKFGKDHGVLEKYSIIKKGEVQQVPINFTYDEEKLKEFEKTIEDKVNVKPKNAQINISNGNISVESESDGKSINIDELDSKIKEALKSNTNETIQLELETTKAKITAEELSKITGPMGSYSSSYGTSAPGRSTNIELATKSINGTILMPGEVFSFNDVVGDRSVERGYQEAGTYVGNKVEPGIGGGICQVSSALYRAAMRANIRSTERTNHSMVVGYMEPGLDATVAYGYLDYKFKNTYDFPIYI